jgi:hypothetical protein
MTTTTSGNPQDDPARTRDDRREPVTCGQGGLVELHIPPRPVLPQPVPGEPHAFPVHATVGR